MIPKKIHYCWLGRGQKPADFHRYYETWRRLLPDYEFKEWNEDNFDVNFCDYSREAYATRNFAHVSDVCRMKALYEEGGIYLDTDIELLKSFDPFLADGSFIGMETDLIGTGVIGAEAGTPWIKAMLDYYAHTHFINIFGKPVRTPNTKILTRKVMPAVAEADRPVIYPVDTFCAMDYITGQPMITGRTVAVHHYLDSWKRNPRTLADRLRIILKGLKIRYRLP
ncbi:MAG: hypothetical protein NC098_02695 [Lachnoclostridium sp.]|nr:hypothetical protein [Lachnoclostridium sp.]